MYEYFTILIGAAPYALAVVATALQLATLEAAK